MKFFQLKTYQQKTLALLKKLLPQREEEKPDSRRLVTMYEPLANDVFKFLQDTKSNRIIVLVDKTDAIAALSYLLSKLGYNVDVLFRPGDTDRINSLREVDIFIGHLYRFGDGWSTCQPDTGLFLKEPTRASRCPWLLLSGSRP